MEISKLYPKLEWVDEENTEYIEKVKITYRYQENRIMYHLWVLSNKFIYLAYCRTDMLEEELKRLWIEYKSVFTAKPISHLAIRFFNEE